MKQHPRYLPGLLALGLVLAAGAFSLLAWAGARSSAAAAPADGTELLPPGAQIQTVLPNMGFAIAMVFDSQGRLFYTEKHAAASTAIGNVRMYANGVLQPSPVITFSVDSCSERGLLGITLDPNFDSNHYMYVYYTAASAGGCGATTNNVARFIENNGVGITPQIIFSSTQTAGNHNGGNIHFGPDGKLYITIGENANAANSQDVTVKNGKIHRINADGSIPADNPVFTQSGALPSLYAMGVRNSFDFDFDPLDASPPYRIFASENGPSCDDEMNRIEAGYNYGWRVNYPCDDANPSPTYNTIPPLWYVPNGQCCVAPTGITVYTGTQIPQWQGELFMTTNSNGALRHFYLDAARQFLTQTNVVQGVTAGMDLQTGPDGAFYYMQGGGYTNATLMRIVGPGGTATTTPAPPSVTPPPPSATPVASATPGQATSTPPPAASATPCTITFTDVDQNNPFYPYIRCLACRGIVAGYGDNTFRPGNPMTRGQVSKIIANSAGYTDTVPVTQQSYADVPSSDPFWLWVERLHNHLPSGVSGYACGGAGLNPCTGQPELCDAQNRAYFRTCANMTRGQLAKVLSSFVNYQDPIPTTQQTFADVPPGNPFWLFVERVAAHGVISGYTCGGPGEPCDPQSRPYYRWSADVTRGQSAKIVANGFFPGCQTPAR